VTAMRSEARPDLPTAARVRANLAEPVPTVRLMTWINGVPVRGARVTLDTGNRYRLQSA
jgi:hypothetical protein